MTSDLSEIIDLSRSCRRLGSQTRNVLLAAKCDVEKVVITKFLFSQIHGGIIAAELQRNIKSCGDAGKNQS